MDADLLRRRSRGRVAQSLTPGARPPVLGSDEDLAPEPCQARSRATRKKLMQAARTLFAEQGYHATSIQAITSRAGTAAGAFYTYFRSKRQLLIVLMRELLERLHGLDLRPQGSADMRAGLRNFLAAVFRADLEYYGVVRAWQEAALTDEGLGRMQAAIESWTHARILGFPSAAKTPAGARGWRLAGLRPYDGPAFLVNIGAWRRPVAPGLRTPGPDRRRRDLLLSVSGSAQCLDGVVGRLRAARRYGELRFM